MASTTQEGTGKHPHKSAAEPEPHHEAPTTKGNGSSHTSASSHTSSSKSHSDEQGTGKHPHKSAAEPEPHNEAPTTKGAHASGSHESGSKSSSQKESSPSTGESGGDLESRAYTGPDGQEHHHTKAYMEQHKGDK